MYDLIVSMRREVFAKAILLGYLPEALNHDKWSVSGEIMRWTHTYFAEEYSNVYMELEQFFNKLVHIHEEDFYNPNAPKPFSAIVINCLYASSYKHEIKEWGDVFGFNNENTKEVLCAI